MNNAEIKTGHTPGPWSIERADSNRVMHFEDDSQTHYRHVAYCGSDWDTGRTGERDKEDTANARLIAAAPDLLVALRACELRFRGISDTGGLLDQINAAIAKSEGK